jgi:hypothetical protein
LAGSGGGGPGGRGDAADPVDGLTSQQAKALAALLQEPTVARAAEVAGVAERTLRRWLNEPTFRDAVFRARREAFGQAIWLTQRYAAVAVATLVKIMNDAAAPPPSKVSAAATLLKFGREGMELDDLAERVEALERARKAERTPPRRNGSKPEEEEDDES